MPGACILAPLLVAESSRMPITELLENLPKTVFYAVMICWVAFAVTFLLRKRPKKRAETKRAWNAVPGLALQGIAYFFVWFKPLARPAYSPIVPLPRWAELTLAIVTIATAVVSVWLVNAAVRRLGEQWAVGARLVEGHRLVTDGPYRLVRNPIYAGIFGMLIATGLAVARWEVLLPAAVVFLLGTWIRVRGEEQLLREAFSQEFEDYARRVPAMIPRVW